MSEIALKKHRDSNIELFRCVSMLLIVAHHYTFFLSPLQISDPDSVNTIFYRILSYVGGKPGIDCFILITGYFMCQKEITLMKYMKLLGQIWFYGILIYVFFLLFDRESFSLGTLINIFFPFRYIYTDYFVSTFLLFYLTIPFLNILLHNISELQHRFLVMLGLYCFVLLPMIKPHGYSDVNEMIWYDIVFIIAAYVRLYPHPFFQRMWMWLLGGAFSFLSVCLLCVLNIGCDRLAAATNSPLALGLSVSTFLVFKNIKMGYIPIINHFGATTFGVLLIHSNSSAMREWLFKDVIDNVGHYYNSNFIFYTLSCIFCIFIVCAIIDMVRIRTVEIIWMKWVTKMISKMSNVCVMKFKL